MTSEARKQAREYVAGLRAANPEHFRSYQRARYAAKPALVLLNSAKYRARKRGEPCTITLADIQVPEFCPVLGIKLEQGKKKLHWASPTLDRIRGELGYVPGNVRVISYRANLLKSDATIHELRMILADAESNR